MAVVLSRRQCVNTNVDLSLIRTHVTAATTIFVSKSTDYTIEPSTAGPVYLICGHHCTSGCRKHLKVPGHWQAQHRLQNGTRRRSTGYKVGLVFVEVFRFWELFQEQMTSFRIANEILQISRYSSVTSKAIDVLHKSQSAPFPYPTMHHFVTEMCTCVHISVTK